MFDHENNQDGLENQDQQTVATESAALNQEEASYKEQYLRLNADFQNFKRRVEKERIEWMQTAQVHVLSKLLTIFDELDRAIQLADKQGSSEQVGWLEGFKLIQKNWQKALVGIGVTEVPTDGAFNPNLHEALMHENAEHKKAGDIVNVFSKGYQLKDKVIQHAKVSVAQ